MPMGSDDARSAGARLRVRKLGLTARFGAIPALTRSSNKWGSKMEIGTELDRQKLAQLEGLAIGLEQRGEKSAAHMIRLAIDDIESLRKALYELLHVSFPPVGGGTPELTKKHYEVVRTGCNLLGINPDGVI